MDGLRVRELRGREHRESRIMVAQQSTGNNASGLEDNLQSNYPVETPVLYLRGDRETGALKAYVKGLRESGLRNVQGRIIPNSGRYAAEEQPNEVIAVLRRSMSDTTSGFINAKATCPSLGRFVQLRQGLVTDAGGLCLPSVGSLVFKRAGRDANETGQSRFANRMSTPA